ncbi:MAG TPA: phosphoribosyl-AMP cyclohydrolase, partial [Ktedonobacteraceae bacterium]|nr:phosphoribosyl-AMP cyclohydrolase [Ktedonobacteraceae bacterium]
METTLKFDRQGLIPAVIQDHATEEVLMVAFMNEEAFHLTRQTGYTHFFSRSRNAIWRKGEQSGNVQEVRDIFVNCEENSLLIRVVQHGEAACHTGYRSCYHRRLLPDNTYETVAERLFDPAVVYGTAHETPSNSKNVFPIPTETTRREEQQKLEAEMRQLYGVYLYLRDHDLSEQSNTSRLLQEHSQSYLVARLADELQELADVQSGEHIHSGRQPDTILEGSQVGYWLLLLAATNNVRYDDFMPHASILSGYYEQNSDDDEKVIEQRQQCLNLLTTHESSTIAQGLGLGFALIGWACARAEVSPLAPTEFDLEQMRRKG